MISLIPEIVSYSAAIVIVVSMSYITWFSRRRLIPALFYATIGVVVFQVLLVALFSKYNLHPDEASHVGASVFFKNHWFKLAVDHPAMLKTLIPGWGSSYLFLNDIVYSLAEKVTRVLYGFGLEDYLRYRLFNFVLLPILLLLFMADRRIGIWFLLAIGLTTQTWYLFAYFNGDALGMFSSLLLGYVFVSKRAETEHFFWEKPTYSTAILAFYILCVLVLFTRLHYAIFVFFIFGLIFFTKIADRGFKNTINGSLRLLIFFLMVIAPIGIAKFADQLTNDFEKNPKIETILEDNKRPEFKLEHIIETGQNPHLLFLKQTGVPYSDLFSRYRWLKESSRSFLGVYGYMNIRATDNFYILSGLVGFGVVFIFLLVSAIRADCRFRIATAMLLLSVFLTIAQSTIYSWTHGFQAQGRYLLAIIPMIAVVLALNPYRIRRMPFCLYGYSLLVYAVNATGFAVFGILPMVIR